MAGEVARYWQHAGVPGVDLLRARYVTHRYSRHAHETFTFALIEAGIEEFNYGGSLLRAGPGGVALLNPDMVHTGHAVPADGRARDPGRDGGRGRCGAVAGAGRAAGFAAAGFTTAGSSTVRFTATGSSASWFTAIGFSTAGGAVTGIWVAVLATAAGCYALKLAGLIVPRGVLGNPRVRRFAELVPIALLAALVAVQTFAAGQSLTIDPARLAGLGAAVAALLLRAPFLVVIVVTAGTAAVLRALGVA